MSTFAVSWKSFQKIISNWKSYNFQNHSLFWIVEIAGYFTGRQNQSPAGWLWCPRCRSSIRSHKREGRSSPSISRCSHRESPTRGWSDHERIRLEKFNFYKLKKLNIPTSVIFLQFSRRTRYFQNLNNTFLIGACRFWFYQI